jgi:hypothetical protein
MSINSRYKGAEGEREAAEFLTNLFKLPVRRGCQYRGGPDSPDVCGLDGLAVEVKRRARLHVESALQQALHDASPVDVPMVMHRADREDWKITIFAKDLLRFLDAANTLIDLGHKRSLAAQSPELEQKQNKQNI